MTKWSKIRLLAVCAVGVGIAIAGFLLIALQMGAARLSIVDREVQYITKPEKSRPTPIPSPWDIFGASPETVHARGTQIKYVITNAHPNNTLRIPPSDIVINFATVASTPEEVEGGVPSYEVWYRISRNLGASFDTFRPLIEAGYTAQHPMREVTAGQNGVWTIGPPIVMSNGEIALPVSIWPNGPDGRPYRQKYAVGSFADAAVLIGRWNESRTDLTWTLSQLVRLDDEQSTRGAFEPTIAELSHSPGHILMVFRASNDAHPSPTSMPGGHKWQSVSSDYGRTWSAPRRFCYVRRGCFYSPSSYSELVRAPNGRLYWIGNISPGAPEDNRPRYPLYIAEVDERMIGLKPDTLTLIDDRNPEVDSPAVQLSNFSVYSDQTRHSLIVALNRMDHHEKYGASLLGYPTNWYRIAVPGRAWANISDLLRIR